MASLPLHFKMFFATHYRSGPALGSQKMQRCRLSVSYCPLILTLYYIYITSYINLIEIENGAAIVL